MNTFSTKVAARPKKSRLLINRNYTLLFIGQGVSLIGDQLSSYTLLLWIVMIIAQGQSWAPLAVSAVMTAGMIPTLLIGPLAGVFVDRWNHRLTMMRMDALRGLLTLSLVLLTGIVPLPFIPRGSGFVLVQFIVIVCVAFLTSVCTQFFGPSYMGLIGEIVPEKHRPEAAGYGQTMQSFASIVGPPLAAPLLISFGLQWALIVDFLTYLVSLITLWNIQPVVISESMPEQPAVKHSVRQEFLEGLRFSFGNALVRMLIITVAICSLGVGAFESLYLFFLKQNLHVDVRLAGIIGAVLGVGTILGAFVASKTCNAIGSKRMLYGSLCGTGLLIIVLSRLTNFNMALGVIFFLGIILASTRVASGPLMLNETPNRMLGRVATVMTPISTIVSLLSTVVAGYLVSELLANLHWSALGTIFGPIDTVFIGVGIVFLLAALYSYRVSRKQK